MLTFVITLQFSYKSRINNKQQFVEGMDTTRLVEAPWWPKSTNSATYNQTSSLTPELRSWKVGANQEWYYHQN